MDSIGRRSLLIVERGKGLRRVVVFIGFEVCWIVRKLRVASQAPSNLKFLGRRSLVAWVWGGKRRVLGASHGDDWTMQGANFHTHVDF